MKRNKMVASDQSMIIKYWDEGEPYVMNTYATVWFHEVDGTVMFIEPFAIMVDDNDEEHRHYYNREKMNENIQILEMWDF